MRLTLPNLGLPLLTKELVEQAARRRTYVLRVIYAMMLFIAGFAFYYQIMARYSHSPFAMLGHGFELYQSIAMLQFAGIYLFMPAMTCGVISGEKERNSLGLLFLTRLGPITIIVEKYLGRVIPMFSFLILSLPLLVIAYALGGITQKYLWLGVWFLSIAVFQIGALSLFCSSFFRTTAGAFIGSYLLTAFMLFFVEIVNEIFRLGFPEDISWAFVAPALFERAQSRSFFDSLFASLPILVSTATFLVLARLCLVRRAFLSPFNLVLKVFKKLDTFFVRLNNNRLTQGVVLIKDNTSLPTLLEPVAWRETTKTSLGSFRYLLRLLILIETPVVFICVLLIAAEGNIGPTSAVMLLLWILSTLIIAVKATSLVASERSHETLDVLLTTPLRSREIVLQKFQGVRRLILVLCVPMLTTVLFKTWFVATAGLGQFRRYNQDENWAIYLTCALLSVAVYLPMTAWLSLLIGLRVRSQNKAIFSTLAAIVAWCVLPVFSTIMLVELTGASPGDSLSYLVLLSPATVIPFNEFFALDEIFATPAVAVMLNFAFYGFVLFVLRAACLRDLDRHLGRAAETLEPATT